MSSRRVSRPSRAQRAINEKAEEDSRRAEERRRKREAALVEEDEDAVAAKRLKLKNSDFTYNKPSSSTTTRTTRRRKSNASSAHPNAGTVALTRTQEQRTYAGVRSYRRESTVRDSTQPPSTLHKRTAYHDREPSETQEPANDDDDNNNGNDDINNANLYNRHRNHEGSDEDEIEDELDGSEPEDDRRARITRHGRKGNTDGEHSDTTASDSSRSSPSHPHRNHNHLPRKRKATDDSSTEADSDTDSKRAKRNSSLPSSSRPKASDYPRDVRAILSLAISIHRSRIASEAPFPDADLEGQIAEEAFQLACRAKKKHCKSDADLIKVITKTTSQMRGELKTIARSMVDLFFGFYDRSTKLRANRRRYKHLTADHAFLYEDPDKLEAMWCSPILFKLIKRMFFKKKNDDGIRSSEYFNPIKPPTIALAYAAVRCALDEWSEGVFDPVDFTTAAYKDVYDELRRGLAELAEDPEGERELTNLGQELWEESSARFGAAPHAKEPAFSQEARLTAIQHLKARAERKRQETGEEADVDQ
ncbi:hypothetical protein BOTBODRAFT_27963 [Botryobasidium botryosum FD-172 SS1]|uniref:DUF6532 domain-containing protein n=1 Tax=Botryobasidium botryosum (strain FD-172 SS1) TaxID=930990 RepID=A0A067N5J1_BOTB1|nr:hypothetical protein BOTBODRAFT_27963 [Botryobasidium botryosum FD-172 SS1]